MSLDNGDAFRLFPAMMFRSLFISLALAGSVPAADKSVRDLVASGALPSVAVPQGVTLKVEADFKNQQISSPTALAFDAQGRVFVTETHRSGFGVEDIREHMDDYTDDLASTRVKDRKTLLEKWQSKPPPGRWNDKSELVRRLADTDGNGTLDESRVYADGFNDLLDGPASAILFHGGAVYLGCIPKLLILRDGKGDGVADERKTVADGFGVHVSLPGHGMGGFTLGPDGRIYGTIGDRGLDLTTQEGVPYHLTNKGAAFRFEADGSGFEIFHTGLRNPKGVAFDALGYPFVVDGGSGQGDAARVVYLVEGGDSGWEMEHQAVGEFYRQIGLKDAPPNRWLDEKMWRTANPEQPAFIVPPVANLTIEPGGVTSYPGTGFLESEAGRFLVCDNSGNPADSGIRSIEMKPDGAGMKMTGTREVLSGICATDAGFSWDGRLFVTDFGRGWKSHDEGRLLSLDAGAKTWRKNEAASAANIMRAGFGQRSSAELANLLKHPDARIRLRAQIALTRKADAFERFAEATLSSDSMVRMHAIWGLGILARKGAAPLPFPEFGAIPAEKIRKAAEEKLLSLLEDPNEEIRCQSLRALTETSSGPELLSLAPLLVDPSPRVRFLTTILIGKRKVIVYYGPVCEMLAENDNRDPYLRHAGAYALARMSQDPELLRIITHSESAAVRLAAVIALRGKRSPFVGDFLGDADSKVADEAIRAVCDLDLTNQRPDVAALFDQLDEKKWPPLMLRRLLHNSYRIGDEDNAARILRFAADPKRPEALRKEAFRLMDDWAKPPPVDQFTGHWSPLEPRDPATLVAVLEPMLPVLLRQDGFALAATLALIDRYHPDVSKLDEAPRRRIGK